MPRKRSSSQSHNTMLKVVIQIDAPSFPQGVKELIAMDLEQRWRGKVKVVSVEEINSYQQIRIPQSQP